MGVFDATLVMGGGRRRIVRIGIGGGKMPGSFVVSAVRLAVAGLGLTMGLGLHRWRAPPAFVAGLILTAWLLAVAFVMLPG